MIEEGSANLSGGQRQRLAIARAVIADPRLMILDEATSALDPESEALVNANLTRLAKGRTMVIVSHRLSSLLECDLIMVMDRGTVVDVAPHKVLLERCAIYETLWTQQNRHLDAAWAPDAGAAAGAGGLGKDLRSPGGRGEGAGAGGPALGLPRRWPAGFAAKTPSPAVGGRREDPCRGREHIRRRTRPSWRQPLAGLTIRKVGGQVACRRCWSSTRHRGADSDPRTAGPGRDLDGGEHGRACTAAAAMVPIDKVVTATARSWHADTIVVQPFETSIVREIEVREGPGGPQGRPAGPAGPDLLRLRHDRAESRGGKSAGRGRAAAGGGGWGRDLQPGGQQPRRAAARRIFAQRRLEHSFKQESYRQQINGLQSRCSGLRAIQGVWRTAEGGADVEGKREQLATWAGGSQITQLQAQDARLDLQRAWRRPADRRQDRSNDLQAKMAEAAADDQNGRTRTRPT